MSLVEIKSNNQENSTIRVLHPLSSLPFPKGKLQPLLANFTGHRIIDTLNHLPTNVSERTYYKRIADCPSGKLATLIVQVVRHERSLKTYRIVCTDEQTTIDLVFFHPNINFLKNIATVGCEITVSGKVELSSNKGKLSYQIVHPDHLGTPRSASQWSGTEPVYGLTAGITQRVLQVTMQHALSCLESIPEWIDSNIKDHKQWLPWHECIKQVHTPKSLFDLSISNNARQRLIYDELLAHQINVNLSRVIINHSNSTPLPGTKVLQNQLIESLPFQLTHGQQQALDEIRYDLARSSQMVRLLQGDVGCGKTLVATIAILQAIESGHQAAFLVPTEILANQHFANLTKLLNPLGLTIELLKGKEKQKRKNEISQQLADGTINFVIGTHAIIQDHIKFSKLGLVIVDEQHRFGVEQRLALTLKGKSPHILSMTATPIPRSLMLAGYGDMDVSLIKEKPSDRLPITTKVISLERLSEIIDAIKRSIHQDNKIYWVCPLIEDSEKLNLTAVMERFEHLRQIFSDQVTLIHGKMKSLEKEESMQSFISGKSKILLATTVIEVGVDVPDATIIVIEHAEHFGLSQLHQLRGRVGRGSKPSTCLLLYGKPLTTTARKRLEIMRSSNDGFHLAEADLRIRGGGDIFGTKQSGSATFRFANFKTDDDQEYAQLVDLLTIANNDAREICRSDPHFNSPRGQAIKLLLKLFDKENALLYKRSG